MKASERELEAARFANDLFERMKEQDLAGELDFQAGLTVYWSLSGYEFEIGQECIEVSKKVGGFFFRSRIGTRMMRRFLRRSATSGQKETLR